MMIMPEGEYWLNKLNIHLDQIEKPFLLNKEQAIKKLASKWDKRICELVEREVGFNGEIHSNQIDFITRLVDAYSKQFHQFLYLTEFAKRKHKAVLNVAEEKLHPDLLQELELDSRSPNGKDILWLTCELFCQDPEILFDVYLKDIEKKHSTGTWFQILFNDESVNLSKLANLFDLDSIKNALAKLDVPNAISCPDVIDRENEKVLFLNAEIAAKIFKFRDSHNQGYSEDWIIARLDKRHNRVRIATKSLNKGAKIVQGVIQAISHVECSLREEDEKTFARSIKKFLNVLLKDKEDADTLVEAELNNAPVDGVGTKIRLKNDFSIAKPLSMLNRQYRWLEKVEDMSRLLYIILKHNDKPYKLKFDWQEESPLSGFVRWDASGIDSDFHEEFKQYMQENYEINICSKRRGTDSAITD